MEWIIGIACSILGVVFGFVLDQLYAGFQKRKAGLRGRAHLIVSKLGSAVNSFEGKYYIANSPTDNYKIANHVYQNADGVVIATCFRENPARYGEADLARNLPNGGGNFTRITTSKVCSAIDAQKARETFETTLEGASLIVFPEELFIASIDGIYCKLTDETYLAFVTFPKIGPKRENRGVLFYGHIAQSFFAYYNGLKEESKTNKSVASS